MADPRHVVLVGMMGSGKSTVGRRVAARLGRPFLDADDELESRTGRTVREWFEAEGEPGFRRAESAVLAELLADPTSSVLAAGGGVVVSEANRRALRAARVVWLRADPAFLASRVARKAHRPLLDDDVAATIARLDEERRSLYEEVADIVVDVDPVHRESPKPKKQLAATIAALIEAAEDPGVEP